MVYSKISHTQYIWTTQLFTWCTIKYNVPWWRHQMETLSALLAICAGNSSVAGEFPAQRPVTRSFDIFFELRLNKRWSKQSWGCWFKTLYVPLWHHCNGPATGPMAPKIDGLRFNPCNMCKVLFRIGHVNNILWIDVTFLSTFIRVVSLEFPVARVVIRSMSVKFTVIKTWQRINCVHNSWDAIITEIKAWIGDCIHC